MRCILARMEEGEPLHHNKRARRLLENPLSHHHSLSIKKPIQSEKDLSSSHTYSRIYQKPVMRRLSAACVFLLFLAACAGICSYFALSPKVTVNSVEASSSMVSSSSSSAKVSAQKQTSSTIGALLYNILPAQDINDSAISKIGEASDCSLYENSRELDSFLGPALWRELEESPDGVFDVIVNIAYADPDSELVSQVQSQSLLSLDRSLYYMQLDEEHIYQYAGDNMEIMLVAPGAPERPQGYPEILDDGCAWIYEYSPDGTPLLVQLSIPIPNVSGSSSLQYEQAQEYLSQELPPYGIDALDPSFTMRQQDGQWCAIYQASLDRKTSLQLCNSGLVKEIDALISPDSSNPVEEEYFYKVYGDGWVFSN
ncbi:MAG: hypothetical protein ACLRV9_01800 [Clostridium sp.]